MNKAYYIEKAKKELKQKELELEVVRFICENNVDSFETNYDRRMGGAYLALYTNEKRVKVFKGLFDNLTILKRLNDVSPYAGYFKGLTSKEIEAIIPNFPISLNKKENSYVGF